MEQFLLENQWIILFIIFGILPWKGVALWKAAKNNHKSWFIALLVFNTMAILEMIYIFVFSKKISKKISEKITEREKSI